MLMIVSVKADAKIGVEGIDVLDHTPVLDIKPYVADFDLCDANRFGWFEGKSRNAVFHRSDGRFAPQPQPQTETIGI